MTFYPGQKVICVKPSPLKRFPKGCIDAVVGRIYTVREYYGQRFEWSDPGLYVEEIVNPENVLGIEYGFFAHRFRPLKKGKTDISVFKKMLEPVDA